MKQRFKLLWKDFNLNYFLFALLVMCSLGGQVIGQSANPQSVVTNCHCSPINNQYPSASLTPNSTWQQLSCQYAGEYSKYYVVQGDTYTWSYLSSDGGSAATGVDLVLNIFDDASQSFIACSDDYNSTSTDPRITWMATFTGYVRVQTTEYGSSSFCGTNTVCSSLSYKKIATGGNYCQCPMTTNQYPSSTLAPTSSWQQISCQYAGEYSKYNVTSGETYIWSYCSADGGSVATGDDVRINLYNDANNSFITCTMDNCGTDPRLEWTATFSGSVRVLTSEYVSTSSACNTNSNCNALSYKKLGTTAGLPNLACVSIAIDDDNSGGSSGNGNGIAEAGETIEIDQIIINNGTASATSTVGTITSSSPYVTITDNDVNFGTVTSGNTDTGTDYDVIISPNCPNGTVITFNVTLTSNEGSWTCSFTVTVSAVAQYTVNTVVSPSNAGTFSGGGTFNSGTNASFSVSPNAGYTFVNVTNANGAVVSTQPNFSYAVTQNETLTANFQLTPPNTYNVTTQVNPSNAGTFSGGGTYTSGTLASFSVSTNPNYTFVNVTDANGAVVSTQPNFTYNITQPETLTANFQIIIPDYTVTTQVSPSNAGTFSGGGMYSSGTVASFSVSTNANYIFENVTDVSGTIISTQPNFTYTITQSETLTANFQQQTHQINVFKEPANGGTIIGSSGVYQAGIMASFTATPNAGFTFLHWKDSLSGIILSTQPTYSFTVNASQMLVAYFKNTSVSTTTPFEAAFKVYPNPTQSFLYVEGISDARIEQIIIYNAIGQEVYQENALTPQTIYQIDASTWNNGTYILQLRTDDGHLRQTKFIKLK